MYFKRLSPASKPSSERSLSPAEQAEIDEELRIVGGETQLLAAKDVPTNADDQKREDPSLIVSFSPSPDEIFRDSFGLEISCAAPEAHIFYALDADDVDENGLEFEPGNPIQLTQTTQVVARAYKGDACGPILSARFDIVKPVWKELEPQDQSDPTPHKTSENLDAESWHIAAASVRGKLHAHRGAWREDSFGLAHVETEGGTWSVVAVSDGAGSAPLSRVGSKIACATTLDSLRPSLGAISTLSDDKEGLITQQLPGLRQALMQAGADALNSLLTEAQTREKPIGAFAATLLVLVLREWNGAWLCGALQVGDGAIALWDGEKVALLGEADHGQNSGETRFLTTIGIENELASRVKFSIKPKLDGFAVMSDGVSDDYFPEDPKLAELFAAVLPLVQGADDAGQTLISWLGYEKRGSSDDRTLVVGWPRALKEEAPSGV